MQTTIRELFPFDHAQGLLGFCSSPASGALWRRQPPDPFHSFIDTLLVSKPVMERQEFAPDEVAQAVLSICPASLHNHPCLAGWLQDIEALCSAFCQELGDSKCLVHLDTDRPCQRFHADNLLIRLVCAYRGPGTLWLANDNIRHDQVETRGTSNEDIVIRPEDIQQLNEWDVLVMKGRIAQGKPLYHRSPPPQVGDPASLLLKLDQAGRF